ncbi:MAG TPA: glycosyltransferase family 39 protein [Kofleriaceae bacterium]|nr:glycosyltransferase family 39 protein [Kofleriaceae bacterium]
MWASGAAAGGAVVALVAWSFWQRWQLLSASPFPLGVDGYFYPLELRSLLEHGELAYPASPLAFYLLAPLAAATDPITGAKLGAALFGAAIAVPAYGVGARLGGGRGAGLLAAALATTSVGSAYLTIEFVKNGIGLTVALSALWLVLRATERPGRARIVAALAGLVAAYATHKMAAGLVGIVAIPAALAAAAARGALRGRRLLYAIGGLIAIGAFALVLGAAFPQRFLSASDARLVRGLLSATPRWTAPALVLPDGELALGHDALLGHLLALVFVGMAVSRAWRRAPRFAGPAGPSPAPDAAPAVQASTTGPRTTRAVPAGSAQAPAGAPARSAPPADVTAAAWPIVLVALAIGLPFLAVTDREGLGFRLRIAAFVPAALTAAIVGRALLARVGLRDLVLAALAAVLVVARQPGDRLEGMIDTHPALVAAAQALRGRVPAGATLIVPERHIAFMVAWYTGAPVAIRPERVPRARRYRLLPLHFIGSDSALDRALIAARAEPSLEPPVGVHPLHPNGLVLVAEPTWEWVLAQLPAADRARFAAWPTI